MGSSQKRAGAPRARPAWLWVSGGLGGGGTGGVWTDVVDEDVDLADFVDGVLDGLVDFGVVLDVDGVEADFDLEPHGVDLCPHRFELVLGVG